METNNDQTKKWVVSKYVRWRYLSAKRHFQLPREVSKSLLTCEQFRWTKAYGAVTKELTKRQTCSFYCSNMSGLRGCLNCCCIRTSWGFATMFAGKFFLALCSECLGLSTLRLLVLTDSAICFDVTNGIFVAWQVDTEQLCVRSVLHCEIHFSIACFFWSVCHDCALQCDQCR